MRVFIQKTNTTIDQEFTGSVQELLEHHKINAEFVIVAKDGVLVTLDEKVDDATKIDILTVVSGG